MIFVCLFVDIEIICLFSCSFCWCFADASLLFLPNFECLLCLQILFGVIISVLQLFVCVFVCFLVFLT